MGPIVFISAVVIIDFTVTEFTHVYPDPSKRLGARLSGRTDIVGFFAVQPQYVSPDSVVASSVTGLISSPMMLKHDVSAPGSGQ
jgi:hypothetical protein